MSSHLKFIDDHNFSKFFLFLFLFLKLQVTDMRQQIWNLPQENLVLGKLDYKIWSLQMSWYPSCDIYPDFHFEHTLSLITVLAKLNH
jgi:hypothetical protein